MFRVRSHVWLARRTTFLRCAQEKNARVGLQWLEQSKKKWREEQSQSEGDFHASPTEPVKEKEDPTFLTSTALHPRGHSVAMSAVVDEAASLSYRERIAHELTTLSPSEEILANVVQQQEKDYLGIDVRHPNTLTHFDGYKPSTLSLSDQVRSVADFVSGHIAHHVTQSDWVQLFDLERLEMDVVFFLWIIHLHLIARRSNTVPVTMWAHRRDVLQELLYNMRSSWEQTAESLMGRPPLQRMKNFVLDMYHVVAIGLEEALCHQGPGGDLAILSVLMRLLPLPRPEDVPMYTYYVLVHYIRFHIAVLDRTSDEMVLKGNYHFVSPLDPSLARKYDEVEFDEMIRTWQANVPSEDTKSDEKREE